MGKKKNKPPTTKPTINPKLTNGNKKSEKNVYFIQK